MDYYIEKGIPIPAKTNARTGIASVMRSLDVGDSFLSTTKVNRITSAISYVSRTKGMKFCIRKVGDLTYRVWRVS
jgi:hypothetical protein